MPTPDSRATFLSAADTFADLVARLDPASLAGPGLGAWDLRSLTGHACRSLVTVETYLDQPADAAEVASAAHYYVLIQSLQVDGAAIVERGRQAGQALGEDPAGFVRALEDRVRDKLEGRDPSYVLTTIAGPMVLAEYLRTRTFELAVHGFDIAGTTGLEVSYDDAVLADAATLAAEIAVASSGGRDLLLALTGRRPLPSGFSVV